MTRIPILLALAGLLAAAPPAAAGEHLIAAGRAYDVSAYRGWLMWTDYDSGRPRGVLWRGSPRRFAPPGTEAAGVLHARLGSDSRGRTVVVYERCRRPWTLESSERDCELVRHSLASGAERVLLRYEDGTDARSPDMASGALALAARESPETSRLALTLFPAGVGGRLLSRDDPAALDMDRGRLAYVAFRLEREDYEIARVIDLRGGRARRRTLATVVTSGQDGRIPGAVVTRFTSAAVDGRYAYWLREDLRDSYDGSEFTVYRADLDDPAAPVSSLWLERPASSIAVVRGTVYYTSSQLEAEAGVYEVRKPAWEDTGRRVPLRD